MSIISETVLALGLIYLGAAVRLLFLFSERSFSSIVNEPDEFKNSMVGIGVFIIIILSVFLFK